MTTVINKTMDRDDLLTPELQPTVEALNALTHKIYAAEVAMSAWIGSLKNEKPSPAEQIKRQIRKLLGRPVAPLGEASPLENGMRQRLHYEPLPGAADDLRLPWFLYWEISWVMHVTRPFLKPGMRLFDGGGASSLFACYLASLGYEVHAIDLNPKLIRNSDRIANAMGWQNMHSHIMNLGNIEFPDAYFDHAYSICVFEHLDYAIKQSALKEIARCLRPGGIFAITFDYRNPAPGIFGYGKDTRPHNQLKTIDDIKRSFLATPYFELMGNQDFQDNGKSYLQAGEQAGNAPYTFGAIFLRKK